MKRALLIFMLAAGVLGMAHAQGTLNGKFGLPTLGPVANGTLLLQLSQAATSGGGSYLAPEQVSCYTSMDGSVVGVPNPVSTPAGDAFMATGVLPAGTYAVAIAYTAANGALTLTSPAASFVLGATGELIVDPPLLQPAAATGYAVYIGATPATVTLQASISGWASYTQATPLSSGAAPAAQNTSTCSLLFNDQILPTGTWYTATLEDAQGNVLPGFPRNWYLDGGSENVGLLTPLASNPEVLFPMPLVANPVNSAIPQSVRSGLNLNGFSITGSGNVGPGFFGTFWSGTAPAAGTTLAAWTPNTAVGIARIDINAQSPGAGGTHGLT
ncbi:MAG: hypothetical protein ACRD1F_06680, partial [Terriglobales bacterium]